MKSRETIGSGATLVSDGELKYIVFDALEKHSDSLIHCMSTRIGGVSTGECSTLNLGFNRKDTADNIRTNFTRLCSSLGIKTDSLVFSKQVHDKRLRIVTVADMGKGFSRESDIKDTDGLLTNTPGVTLVTFYADCVPVFLFDPVKKAAGLVHSGWRSTYLNIVGESVRKMVMEFGSDPHDITAVIGPSIGHCCFEVGEEVYQTFKEKFKPEAFYERLQQDKWKIDLQAIIIAELTQECIAPYNIHNSGICTKCRRDLFFSHRGDRGATGSLAAFMQLRS